MNIIGPDLQRVADCETVLLTLPKWFGIERALRPYARDSAEMPTFGLIDEDRLVGFQAFASTSPRRGRFIASLSLLRLGGTATALGYLRTQRPGFEQEESSSCK